MFSNAYKQQAIKRFNLPESIINSPIHYKIPKFVFQNKNEVNNQCEFHHPSNSLFKLQIKTHPDLLLDKSSHLNKITKTQYSENKKRIIYNLLTKVQREKLDLLIDKAYQKINNNIRKYNKSISIPKNRRNLKLKPISLISKEFIIDHAMGQVQKYFHFNLKNKNNSFEFVDPSDNNNNSSRNRELVWSHNFIEDKKNDDYRKRYRIKYIDTEDRLYNNLKKEKMKKDKSIPTITKIKNETFFSTQKSYKTYNLHKRLNNLRQIYTKNSQIENSNK
mgnify:CR=1 FL=1